MIIASSLRCNPGSIRSVAQENRKQNVTDRPIGSGTPGPDRGDLSRDRSETGTDVPPSVALNRSQKALACWTRAGVLSTRKPKPRSSISRSGEKIPSLPSHLLNQLADVPGKRRTAYFRDFQRQNIRKALDTFDERFWLYDDERGPVKEFPKTNRRAIIPLRPQNAMRATTSMFLAVPAAMLLTFINPNPPVS